MLSSLLLTRPSLAPISSSAPYSRTPLANLTASKLDTQFHTHKKNKKKNGGSVHKCLHIQTANWETKDSARNDSKRPLTPICGARTQGSFILTLYLTTEQQSKLFSYKVHTECVTGEGSELLKVCKSLHHYTIQINRPTRCNNSSSLLLDVYVQLNMFRASSRPSSGAQQLQQQPLVLPLERGGTQWYIVHIIIIQL